MKKTADSTGSSSIVVETQLSEEENIREQLMNRVLETEKITEETTKNQKDKYLTEGE